MYRIRASKALSKLENEVSADHLPSNKLEIDQTHSVFRRIVASITLLCFTLSPYAIGNAVGAGSAPVADPGAAAGKRPDVTSIGSVPVVNITAPNSNGLSHNQFKSFDVPTQGAILNNRTNAGSSSLTGSATINANPNLGGTAARIILNEVTGSGRSNLLGPLEVSGNSARIIVANPNGITCDGCSFINTPHVQLSTGKTIFDGDTIKFDVTGGDIQIGPKGLTALAHNLDLIAYRIATFGALGTAASTSNVSIISAQNSVIDENLNSTPRDVKDSRVFIDPRNPPAIAIDIGQSVAAGTIKLIVEGSNVTGEAIKISAPITAKQDIAIATRSSIIVDAPVTAGNDLGIANRGAGVLMNGASRSGSLNAGRDMQLTMWQAQDGLNLNVGRDLGVALENTETASGFAGTQFKNVIVDRDVKIIGNDSATFTMQNLTAGRDILVNTESMSIWANLLPYQGAMRSHAEFTGSFFAFPLSADPVLNFDQASLISNGNTYAARNIIVAGNARTASFGTGNVEAGNNIQINIATGFTNRGSIKAGNDISITAPSFDNISSGNSTTETFSDVHMENCLVDNGGSCTVTTESEGKRASLNAKNIYFNVGTLTNYGGDILASNNLYLGVDKLSNRSIMLQQRWTGNYFEEAPQGDVNKMAGTVLVKSIEYAPAVIEGGQLLGQMTGNIAAGNNLVIGGRGATDATGEAVVSGRATEVDNRGRIFATNAVTIHAEQLTNQPEVAVVRNTYFTERFTGCDVDNDGQCVVDQQTVNRGQSVIESSKDIFIDTKQLDNHGADILAGRDLLIGAETLNNTNFELTADWEGKRFVKLVFDRLRPFPDSDELKPPSKYLVKGFNIFERVSSFGITTNGEVESRMQAGGKLLVGKTLVLPDTSIETGTGSLGSSGGGTSGGGGSSSGSGGSSSGGTGGSGTGTGGGSSTPAVTGSADTFSSDGKIIASAISISADKIIHGVGYDERGKRIEDPKIAPSSVTLASSFSLPMTGAGSGTSSTPSGELLRGLLPPSLIGTLPFAMSGAEEEAALRAALLSTYGRAWIIDHPADIDPSLSADEGQHAVLLANTAAFALENGIPIGKDLTEADRAKLDAPMLWYVNEGSKLVPKLYIPDSMLATLSDIKGGLLRSSESTTLTSKDLDNTGFIITDGALSISTDTLENRKRLATLDEKVYVDHGYIHYTGETVEPGGYMSAALWDLHTESIKSVSGEFKVAGSETDSAAFDAALKAELGDAYMYSEVHDDVHSEFVCTDCKKSGGLGLIAAIVVMVIAAFVMPAIAGAIGSMAGAVAGSGTAWAAGITTVAGETIGAGLANTVATAAATSFISSTATQAITTGRVDLGKAGESALTSGVTAGLSYSLSSSVNSAIKSDGLNPYVGSAITTLGNAALATIGGTSFEDALKNQLISEAAASGANVIGDETFGPAGSVGHALAHGALGAIIASARGQDPVAGAIGGLGEAVLSTQLSGVITDDKVLEIAIAAITGSIAEATGHEGTTAMAAAQNAFENNYLYSKAKRSVMEIPEQERYSKALQACKGGDAAACTSARQLEELSKARDREFAVACSTPGSSECRGIIRAIYESGYVIESDEYGKPVIRMNLGSIGPIPDPREGTVEYQVAKGVTEGLLLETEGAAISWLLRGGAALLRVTANALKPTESVLGSMSALDGQMVGSAGTRDLQILQAQKRQQQMLVDDVGYNISPFDWEQFPTIGRNGTFLTDKNSVTAIFGKIDSNTSALTITKEQAINLEIGWGLERGSLSNGFSIREVSGITKLNPRSPLEGNQYFQGTGKHLPDGSPELVVDSIATKNSSNVTKFIKVNVK